MADFKVTVYLDSNGTHLHQVYTGLFLLSQNKEIDLVLRPGIPVTHSRPNRQFLALAVEREGSKKKFIFDLQDSPVIGLPRALSWCDFYLKRSLENSTFTGLDEKSRRKLRPYGFNYQVLSSSKSYFFKRLFLEFFSRPYNPFSQKNRFHLSNLKEYFEAMWKMPSPLLGPDTLTPGDQDLSNNILFQCRLWDPNQMAEQNREDAERINTQRVEVIRQLKTEFGSNFLGGLQHNDYAQRVAPDLLINSKHLADRNAYISLVKKSRVVISSSGLLGSNGWKLGEYVALGKCIISEPIETLLPGTFRSGVHYLQYTSADECVEKVVNLFKKEAQAEYFMKNTTDYYFDYLAPDVLIRNLLVAVFD